MSKNNLWKNGWCGCGEMNCLCPRRLIINPVNENHTKPKCFPVRQINDGENVTKEWSEDKGALVIDHETEYSVWRCVHCGRVCHWEESEKVINEVWKGEPTVDPSYIPSAEEREFMNTEPEEIRYTIGPRAVIKHPREFDTIGVNPFWSLLGMFAGSMTALVLWHFDILPW